MTASSLNTLMPVDRDRILDTLVNNLDGMAYRCRNDAHWTMLFVSQGCLDLTGYEPHELLTGGSITWEGITHEDDRAHTRREIELAFAKRKRFALRYRIVTREGDIKWVVERGVPVADEMGLPAIEGFVEDVTQLLTTQEALLQAEQRYRHIFEHASEGIFQTSQEGLYVTANQALARMYGYATPEELIADLTDVKRRLYVLESRREAFCHLMATCGEVKNFESEVYRRDGSKIWISENAHVVHDAQGRFVCYEGTVQDITERRDYQAQLERQANHDLLTGLPNRNLLADRLEQAIARAERLGGFLALVFIDLDNFKFINDTLGHAAGDELLMEVAQRLHASLRGSDTVARQGGDEFVLVLNDHQQVDSIISVLERILVGIGRPVTLAGRALQIGASLGVALYPQDGRDGETLLKHADVAMYAAKQRGRNNFQFFTPTLNHTAQERLTLETEMRSGLARGEFSVHVQPKVDHRRRIVGVEALARWHSPRIGQVTPDRFIPIAEETGLILPLTEVVLEQAFKAAAAWPALQGRHIQVAVNLSPMLFLGDDLVARVHHLLCNAGLAAERVELEITESVFMGDSERALRLLGEFKALGYSLVMDDFGTGYSSLSYLRRFPLDTIKIDRSLVTDIEHDEESAMIARAVISLGQSLRKTVVAEGVENPAQFDFLRYQGCDEFQGYLIARPMSTADFTDLLARTGGQL